MILELNHKKLNVFFVARNLIKECYKLNTIIPDIERYNLKQQIIRAATSIILNISEGASRSSPAERKRFYEIARGSIIEIDTALQVAFDLNYLTVQDTELISPLMRQCFGMLSKMIHTLNASK